MNAIEIERTARKRYVCSRCRLWIQRGQRYIAWALPPNGETGYRWSRGHEHLPEDCM